MHRTKISGRKLAVFALVAAFVLGPSWNNPATSEVINIGWTGEYWSTLPFRVATDMGFLEREGLQTRLITMRTALITPALMQGDLEYSGAAFDRGRCAPRSSGEDRWCRQQRDGLCHCF
jgi:ABC-type nitrate/sulfonate/bicarbonate transport system substrate-binding protein